MTFQFSVEQELAAKDDLANNIMSLSSVGPTITNATRLNIELPFYSKFLLIASFLASYNPAKSDKR